MTIKLDKETPVPLYYQVMQILQNQIENGEYGVGSYIPTEAKLQEDFKVSRATIRKALSELVHQGYLERRRSKGTIVAGVKLEEHLQDLCSFTDQFISNGIPLVTKIVTFETIPSPPKVAKKLAIGEGSPVHFMERLRMVEKVPVAFERWYAPEDYFPGLSRAMFSENGFEQSTYYILYKRFGLKVVKAEDTISPTYLDLDEMEILRVTDDVPALLRTRVSYDASEKPVNYGSGVYLIKIKMSLGIKQP